MQALSSSLVICSYLYLPIYIYIYIFYIYISIYIYISKYSPGDPATGSCVGKVADGPPVMRNLGSRPWSPAAGWERKYSKESEAWIEKFGPEWSSQSVLFQVEANFGCSLIVLF